jgi:hypothetical protein
MRYLVLLCAVILCCGCQTTKPKQSNQDLQSVLSDVKKSFNMQDARAKYCPVCGKHYNGHIEICPVDQTKLLPIE